MTDEHPDRPPARRPGHRARADRPDRAVDLGRDQLEPDDDEPYASCIVCGWRPGSCIDYPRGFIPSTGWLPGCPHRPRHRTRTA